jgi:HPt (histidine-containing phosphotransfer) domain-containing protein
MTAHATMEERQRCLAAGMNDHISKPIEPRLLFETVGRFYKVAEPVGSSGGEVASKSTTAEARATQPGDNLPVIEGLDTKDGLSRVAANRKLYVKLLRQFVEQQGPALEHISTALAGGDMALAERLAHTLKGVAGNIGATGVQAAAGPLEKLIRAKAARSEVDSVLQQVATVLDPLIAQLRAALGAPAAETPVPDTAAPADPAQVREAVARLNSLLSEFDPGAVDFMETNRAVLRPLFSRETWTQFEALIQSYAFADAHARLEQALKNFLPA